MKSLQLLSKYRSTVMGLAILWVFIFHFFPYESTYKYDVLLFVSKFGYAGVDIFLLVSGFGLYYGYGKYKSKKQFYRKRFLRILPTYVLFVLFTLLVSDELSLTNFISMFCNIGSFGGNYPTYNWYMTAIMLFYLLFPFYVTHFNRAPLRNTLVSIVIALALNFSVAWLHLNTAILLTRIPIFCLGIFVSYLLKNNVSLIKEKTLLILAAIAFIVIVSLYYKRYDYTLFWFYGVYWIPFLFIIPGLLIVFTYSLDRVSKFCPFIIKGLNFLGSISLEIYLIHINPPFIKFIISINPDKSFVFFNTLLISVIGGYVIHKIMASLIKI